MINVIDKYLTMTIQTKELFPTTIFEFYNSDLDFSDICNKLDKENWAEHSALSSKDNLHVKTKYSKVFTWIDTCLEQVRQHQKYDCDKLSISSSWANKNLAGEKMYHQPHRHSMSFYSGILYLTHGSPTVLEDCVTPRVQAQIEVLRHDYAPFEYIMPEPGKLVLFPSFIYHSSGLHYEDYDRYNISFNVLPSGKINYNLATDSIAVLDVSAETQREFKYSDDI